MSTEHRNGRVAGERADDLVHMLTQIQPEPPGPDGSYRFHFEVKKEEWAPFMRALMRIEAELLLLDANLVDASGIEPRTSAQRRADAVVALVLRVLVARRRSSFGVEPRLHPASRRCSSRTYTAGMRAPRALRGWRRSHHNTQTTSATDH